MFGLFPLLPAYGRDYKSRKAMLVDLNKGLDFMTSGGSYTNLDDLQAAGHTGSVNVRSADRRKVWVVKVGATGDAK
tara:strand:+ start:2429 stop:2656 length:228 start_codon:yes stop_codon:yes gene_type:complete